jgi:hypothetical protein
MANKPEIIDEIEGLAVHCRPPIMEVGQRSSWLGDWCNDLAEFEIEAIRGACREWRQSGAIKFPTPGQLLPMVRKRASADRAADHNGPWRPLSDAEYGALGLREKIRHQQILAAEARRKAGPMWRNPPGGASIQRPKPGHVEPHEMSPAYRKWSEIASGHEAEAKRLRGYLRSVPVAAE